MRISNLIRYIIFLPIALLVSAIAFYTTQFILLKLLIISSGFEFLRNGPFGEMLFGEFPVAILPLVVLVNSIVGYVFVFAGSLVAPYPRKNKIIILAVFFALISIGILLNEAQSIVFKIAQFLGFVIGGIKALIVSFKLDDENYPSQNVTQ